MDPNIIWQLETEQWEGREEYRGKVIGFLEAEAKRQASEDTSRGFPEPSFNPRV